MRQAILFNERGLAASKNVRTASTGEPLIFLDEGEQTRVELDFTAFLASGETISSVTTSGTGVTASATLSSPLVTLTLSNATTYAPSLSAVTLTVTLSTGDKKRIVIRVRRTNRFDDEAPYQDYT